MSKLNQISIASSIFNISAISKDEDFVACIIEIDEEGICSHSGLLICYEQELKYFHYTGKKVELTQDLSNKFLYFKKLDIIDDEDVLLFLFHCEKLSNEVDPIYGFVFDDSYYDSNGNYYLKGTSEKDITTCVGFCLKVLNGFLSKKYLETGDWDSSSLDSLGVYNELFKKYLQKQGIDTGVLFNNGVMKRILPSEMLSSSFFKDLPIRKDNTDCILSFVENHFLQFKVA